MLLDVRINGIIHPGWKTNYNHPLDWGSRAQQCGVERSCEQHQLCFGTLANPKPGCQSSQSFQQVNCGIFLVAYFNNRLPFLVMATRTMLP